MSDILLDNQGIGASPSSGQTLLAVNNTTKLLQLKDDAGFVRSLNFKNFSVASQVITTSRTYIAGSNIKFPQDSLQIGTLFRWTFDITKSAAGTAAATYDIAFGVTGTTTDTARVSFTKPAGTAAIDAGRIMITAICRGPLGASGIVVGQFNMTHNLASTGHATIPCVNVTTVSSAFDVSTPTNVGICLTGGAADSVTLQLVLAEAWNL